MCPTGSVLGAETRRKTNLRSAFDVLDVDNDGKISHNDLRTIYGGFSASGMSSEQEKGDDDVIGTMISVADSNKDGFVEYDEFEKVLGSRRNGRRGLMEDVFKVMDRDGDGIVGYEDLKSYLSWAGFDVNDDDVKAMIGLGGGHEHGGVTFESLLKILAF